MDNAALSKVKRITNQLRDVHLQSLFATLRYGLAPIFDHWLQHCFPDDILPIAGRLDESLAEVLRICIPGIGRRAALTQARVQLPARKFGLGLRSRVDIAPAAFVGAFCEALPRMIDVTVRNGAVKPGFMR